MPVGDVHIVGTDGWALCGAGGPLRGYNATSAPCRDCKSLGQHSNWLVQGPLSIGATPHFGGQHGASALLRKRPTRLAATLPPRIVGIMMAKDEADVAQEVIPPLVAALDALYYFAGDTETARGIHRHSPAGWARSVAMPDNTPHSDGLRHYLLAAARADKLADGDDRPMWVLPVQGDEIYHDTPRDYVLKAHAEGARVMACQVATFLLHESQREGWDWTQPLSTRMTHYIRDFGEHMGFLDGPEIFYVPTDHMRAHPHGIPVGWGYASARPVRKHYPFRSPEQARQRLADRIKSNWQPHYHNYTDVFMSNTAAGRTIHRFSGDFSIVERKANDW